MWGFLLGGALSLIGSLFSRPEPQPAPPPPPPPPPPAPAPQVVVVEKQTSTVDMKQMVKDSEEAGFNPLTVLRNGGLAGYQVTNVPFLTTNPAFVDWEARNKAETDRYNWQVNTQEIAWRNTNADKQWMGSLISNVGGMAMNFAEKYNPTVMANAEHRRVLENRLLESEILRNNSSVAKMFQPSVATASGNVLRAKNGNASLAGSPYYESWKLGDVSVTNPNKLASVDPNYADAEGYETRYGDLAQEVYGWRNQLVDWYYTARGNSIDDDASAAWAGVKSWAGQYIKVKPASSGSSNSFSINGVKLYDAGAK